MHTLASPEAGADPHDSEMDQLLLMIGLPGTRQNDFEACCADVWNSFDGYSINPDLARQLVALHEDVVSTPGVRLPVIVSGHGLDIVKSATTADDQSITRLFYGAPLLGVPRMTEYFSGEADLEYRLGFNAFRGSTLRRRYGGLQTFTDFNASLRGEPSDWAVFLAPIELVTQLKGLITAQMKG